MTGDTKNPITEAIDGAEEILDPLDGLIETTRTDPGAPFKKDVLERLMELKNNDSARFEVLRNGLKKAGCRVTRLDVAIAKNDAIPEKNGADGGRAPKQADTMIELAASAELFHTSDKVGYADLVINGHRETWPIRAKGFKRWLAYRYFEETKGAPNSEALQSALNVLEAKADFGSQERVVYIRVGGLDGKLYLDLCNDGWQAVEISAQSWRVVDNPPVRFRRAAGMKPLPIPVPGGSVKELKPFLNVEADHDFVLAVTYMLAALRPRGPYPVLVAHGEHGSAKTTFCKILKQVVDPNTTPSRGLPREERDLFITARNGHILSFDNVSVLSPWISDALCRLATGGGFVVRELHTDQDEVLFNAVRPSMLNGIEEFIARPDLADRSLLLTLKSIPEENRRPEEELWDAFDSAHPRILGALLDAAVKGLEMLPRTRLKRLPRMADFAIWATACETAFWPSGTFEAAYGGNRKEAVEVGLESDLVAIVVRSFIKTHLQWTGTATDLLGALVNDVSEQQKRSKEWPTSARALSGQLRRLAPSLRKVAIGIDFKHAGTRKIRIFVDTESGRLQPSIASAPSTDTPKTNGANGLPSHPGRTTASNADDERPDSVATVRANPRKFSETDAADAEDANIPRQSATETSSPDKKVVWRI